jgi:hypothetical protein
MTGQHKTAELFARRPHRRARAAWSGRLSFGRRAFLVSFIAVCAAIAVTFVAVNIVLRTEIKAGIKDALRRAEQSMEQARAGQNLRNAAALEWAAAEPALAAAVEQAGRPSLPDGVRARATQAIHEQLRSVRGLIGSDWLAVSGASGSLLAVLPPKGAAVLPDAGQSGLPRSGLWTLGGTLYDITTAPVRLHGREVGTFTAGTRFDFAGVDKLGPAGLVHRGRLVRSTFPPDTAARIGNRLAPGCASAGCELRIGAEDFLIMPVSRAAAGSSLGPEDQLLSFRSIDRAMEETTRRFRVLLPAIIICNLLVAICISALASRAVSRPLRQLIARLDGSEGPGRFAAGFPENSPTSEINQLAASLNRAARAVAVSNERLDHAAIEFIETMAQALDARDPYTAGHSNRVSDYATAIATAMGVPADQIEIIRVGAQLHDIGKIGIPDAVLQKAGYLTPEEYELVKLHPQIGKRILERVAQFEKYLPIVELHHEDMDGRGYPYGLKGGEVPLAVRIVHVADVFDALTTDRAYRQAMTLQRAHEIIELCSGTQFDPQVVEAFTATFGAKIGLQTGAMEPVAALARE